MLEQTNGKAVLLGGAMLAVIACGCTEQGLDKAIVHGHVEFAGEPVENGQIRFIPVEGTIGPVSGGVIHQGEYIAKGKGGVPFGKHRVEITAYRPVDGKASVAVKSEGGASEQYIPSQYNGQSSLEIELTNQNSSEAFDFKLEP